MRADLKYDPSCVFIAVTWHLTRVTDKVPARSKWKVFIAVAGPSTRPLYCKATRPCCVRPYCCAATGPERSRIACVFSGSGVELPALQ